MTHVVTVEATPHPWERRLTCTCDPNWTDKCWFHGVAAHAEMHLAQVHHDSVVVRHSEDLHPDEALIRSSFKRIKILY